MQDTLQKFMFEHAGVRGELVEISNAWQQIQARHEYPAAVKTILGELTAASALLCANLKFNGTMIMQIYGDGPVKLLVVECDAELRIRATAKLSPNAVITDNASLTELVHANGQGRFVITLDPNDKLPGQQAYQGIVPIDGDSIAGIIENYMMRSEQLDTKLWLAADDKIARGMLLQKLPKHGGIEAKVEDETEAWNRAISLGGTLKQDELLTTDIETLLHRLFWEETIRIFDPQHPQFHCNCTREKVGNMLRMLGEPEINTAIAELGRLDINCDFCGKHYGFDQVDCAQLFVANTLAEATSVANDSKH
ncbi:Hsp33 family molecular chaperone HslO [Undibacterium sp. RTI2.1]|uniref:Hsp33 family molecular chaperone HslO n=1 Tax=unclassified Undibacterium TaxID=2630295 RepID=UPI002AB3491B|nr:MULTISPECIES: Hsp33 family molecular chaperone HslO [unclassified Undibacterium]MDY7537083.1 Hsp33 family molecular chaperone HslO [Undibacterium sp. 5I1]MEB0029878.1 Hsp33 family molecular chaperone HslO [Undibacterium sp. RTI2.1]MEB0115163.1 Hsp33 family molecular chaperone HslO [Undibacterium sp. RTI2.2]MEB0229261.1 Hsp33 family molecular chaperone HslO [Undibacterium sp. 10I3]MEB0256191.1 Hsp33 family molecular chaperone HslO [Undibacterium sp. 5I1]